MAARTTGEVGKMNLVLCRAGENIALMDAHLQAWRSLSLVRFMQSLSTRHT